MLNNLNLIDYIIYKALQHPRKYQVDIQFSTPNIIITRKANKRNNIEEEEIFEYYKGSDHEFLTMSFGEIQQTYIQSFSMEMKGAEGHFVNNKRTGENTKDEDYSNIDEHLEDFLNNIL